MARVTLVIPTYNERENITPLIKEVFSLTIPDLEVLVVDDNSPDGTAEEVKNLSNIYQIRLLRRPKKEGLGRAYAAAFKELLNEEQNPKPEFILQMDADLSHNPRDIPRFLTTVKACDLVLGSRYIKDGKIVNWGLLRRFLSRAGNIYARIILSLPYKDLTGGFKCFRREVLEKINLDSLHSVGYNFQVETTYRAHHNKFRIKEIPITFTERRRGKSKLDLSIILESFWRVFLLRVHE